MLESSKQNRKHLDNILILSGLIGFGLGSIACFYKDFYMNNIDFNLLFSLAVIILLTVILFQAFGIKFKTEYWYGVHFVIVVILSCLLFGSRHELRDAVGYTSIKGYKSHIEYEYIEFEDGDSGYQKNYTYETENWVGTLLIIGITNILFLMILVLYCYVNVKLYVKNYCLDDKSFRVKNSI
jgi:Na+/melibiose symporter-like transporter